MFTQYVHYADITIFQKNNENCTFYKVIIFNQNRKYGKSGRVIILLKTMCVTFEVH